MSLPKRVNSIVLAVGVASLYFIGEAFKAIAPVQNYKFPIGVINILTWSSLRFFICVIFTFAVIHFGFQAKKKLVSHACQRIVASFVLVSFVFGIVSIADISIARLFDDVKEGKIYLTLFIGIFVLLCTFRNLSNHTLRLVNFSKVVSLLFLLLFSWRIYSLEIPLVVPYVEQTVDRLELSNLGNPPRPRRVVFVIFDEFDPSVAFSGPEVSTKLKNFENLLATSFFAPNALPPAKYTLASIPAMLVGKPTLGNFFDEKSRLFIRTSQDAKVEFNQANSIFGRLDDGPSSAAILGFYHPYCKLFETYECISFSDSKYAFKNSWRLWHRKTEGSYVTKTQIELLPSFLGLNSKQLIYIHLNIPHLGARYAASAFGLQEPSGPNQRYELNLRLSDEVLGLIVESLQRSSSAGQEVLLVICSDHWFRQFKPSRDESNGLPALAIVKVLSDDTPVVLKDAISTHHLPELSVDFLHGKIKSNADVRKWFSGKPLFDTYLKE